MHYITCKHTFDASIDNAHNHHMIKDVLEDSTDFAELSMNSTQPACCVVLSLP